MALEVPYTSIPDMFLQRVAKTPDKKALGYPSADGSEPQWLTWQQVHDKAVAIAAGLHELGVGPEDRVSILSNTRIEWVIADFGIMCAGGATTTVYPTTEPADAAFIVHDSGSKVAIVENADQATKLADVDALSHIVLITGEPVGDNQLTLDQLAERGTAKLAADPELITRLVADIRPDHLATLIYTSGTTGRPKGVELLHAGWCWEGVAQAELGILKEDDLQYLWLPLSHSFGKTLICGLTHVGASTYVDGRVDKLIENLALIKPTLMCSAPRVFEKVYNRVVTSGTAAGGLKAKIFGWAVGVGKQKVALEQAGKPVPSVLNTKYQIAEKLVFSKLQERLGGNIRILVSGSAPLAKDIAEFFAAAGLPICEGYGLTETSAGNFVNRPGKVRIGTVGQPLGDLEVRIAEDGEILLRGAPLMRGYHNLPDETASVFTDDGWFRTGDIGELDEGDYLRITDRKKDLIKTSGGKYIAPSLIEGRFKSVCPYVSQAVIIGQARNFVSLLVTLDPDSIVEWAAGGPHAGKSYAEIVTSSEANAMVAEYVEQLNGSLNRWETIKKFTILHRDLTTEDGEMTPSMKIKRRGVEANFADDIDRMYAGSVAKV